MLRRAASEAEVDFAALGELEYDAGLLSTLMEHSLPGNFRDLYRVAFHLLSGVCGGMTREEAIREARRALEAPSTSAEAESPILPSIPTLIELLPLDRSMTDFQREYRERWVSAAMAATNGVVTKAAELVRVPRKTFETWVKAAGK